MAVPLYGTSRNGPYQAINNMKYLFLNRLTFLLSQLLITSLLAFLIMNAAPGDPVASLVGGREFMTDTDHDRVSNNLGLDQPVLLQYGNWLINFIQGDWGNSIRDGRDVATIVFESITTTFNLIGTAWLLLIVIGVPMGCWAGIKAQSPIDYTISSIAMISFAMPVFWMGLLLIYFFSITFNWLPSSGQHSLGRDSDFWDYLKHLILPVSCIVLTHVGPYIRLVRGGVQDVMTADYYRSALARGLKQPTLIIRYVLPNALTPFITWVGLTFPLLIGGTFIVEWVFSWPGIGRLFLQAAIARDYPVLMATVVATTLLVIFARFTADMLVLMLNPKLRRKYLHEE